MQLRFKPWFFATFATLAACGAQPNGGETSAQTHEALGPAGITSYSTDSVWVGDAVTIYGNGFTTDGYTQVAFSGNAAPFTNTICATTTSCTFNVPEIVQGLAAFSVKVAGTQLPDYSGHAGVLNLKAPQITGVSPTTVSSAGGTVTLTGHGFFDGKYAGEPIEWVANDNQPMQVWLSPGSDSAQVYGSNISCNYFPGTRHLERPARLRMLGSTGPVTSRG